MYTPFVLVLVPNGYREAVEGDACRYASRRDPLRSETAGAAWRAVGHHCRHCLGRGYHHCHSCRCCCGYAPPAPPALPAQPLDVIAASPSHRPCLRYQEGDSLALLMRFD